MGPDWQPQITTMTSPLITGTSFVLTGSRFQGISQASGGNLQDSSANYPVVPTARYRKQSGRFSSGGSNSRLVRYHLRFDPVNNFPPGLALVTVFTNGIPSDSKYVLVASPASSPTPTPTATATATATFTLRPNQHRLQRLRRPQQRRQRLLPLLPQRLLQQRQPLQRLRRLRHLRLQLR
jgi:hypothetical protein